MRQYQTLVNESEGSEGRTLEEDLEYTTSLFVNQTRDTFDSSTTSETTNRRLGDTLNVVTQLSRVKNRG